MHIEIPDTYSAEQVDELVREITMTVYRKHNVILAAIGVYSLNTKNQKAVEIRENLKKNILQNPYILQMHGFYLNEEKKTIRFDVIVSFDAPDRKEAYKETVKTARTLYPEYDFQIAMDTDFTEE